MSLTNGRSDFDEQFFSKNTSISKGTDIFSLGGDFFTIKTNLEKREVRDVSIYLENFSEPIGINDIVKTNDVKLNYERFAEIDLNFDKTILTNHAYFGSLKDKFRHSITYIVDNFPASIYVNNDYNAVLLTILGYSYNPISNRANFRVPLNAITNNYNLKLDESDNVFLTDSDELRNLPKAFSKYSLWDFSNEFPIVGFTGKTEADNYIHIEVLGNPYPSMGSSGLKNFHIKPNNNNYVTFLDSLDSFQGYLLNRDSSPRYTATFQVPNFDNDGNSLIVEEDFTWRTTDGYNLDYNTYEFQTYLGKLDSLASSMDDYKTNLISRYLTSSSIKEFDTEDQRTDKLLKLYGKQYDDIKQYIDGLANIARVTYDKKDNMPDVLVKNFARTLGWGTFSTITEKDLMKSVLGQQDEIVLSGTSKNYTPAETDIELWRRLVLNSSFLFQSKGTRDCIDFLFKIVGAPKSLVDFNEYVYIAQNKINVDAIQNSPDLNFPFDEEGYPKVLPNTPDYYFQMKGGWISNKEIAPTNGTNYSSVIGIHTGEYDGGKSYFKAFTDFEGQSGFDLYRVVDNIKSWTSDNNVHKNLNRGTDYLVTERRMVLNSKEASIYLNPAMAVETDVYEYNKATGFVINPTTMPYPYPDNVLTRADLNSMSFIQYLDFIYSRFINVKNRKTIETFGNGYPTLKKLYEDYISKVYDVTSPSKALTTNRVLDYIEQLGDFWLNLIEQFVPSTTIWQGGVVYKNTVYDRQKFDYKQGINDGSEFEFEQITNPDINLTTAQIDGFVGLPFELLIDDIAKADVAVSASMSFPEDGGGIVDNGSERNILRVKPFFGSDVLAQSQPCMVMAKVSKIITGTTAPIIHNISNGNKQVDFTFNCNLDFFTDGGEYKYNVYEFNKVTQEFAKTSVYEKLYNNLVPTGSTLTVAETIDKTFIDGDYIIKPSFNYSIELTGNTHANILDYFTKLNEKGLPSPAGFSLSGTTFTFDSGAVIDTFDYGIYDEDSDYWFSIISQPFRPIINSNIEGGFVASGTTLVNKVLTISSNLQKDFIINDIPSGDIIFAVNGNILQKSETSDFTGSGEYYGTVVGSTYAVTLKTGIDVYTTDVISVIYLKSEDTTEFDSLLTHFNTIPSGTTAGSGPLYNTSTGKYEFYLPFTLNVDVQFSDMVVALNGNILNIYSDYYMEVGSPQKIIFSGVLLVGDDLLLYYPNNDGGSYYIPNKMFIANWNAQNDDKTGKYIVEVSEGDDFGTIIMSKETDYIPSTPTKINQYSLYVGNFTVPFNKYFYRVKSIKNNINILGEVTTTTEYSNIMYFETDNRVLE